MNLTSNTKASQLERAYVEALSRDSVIEAYSKWKEFSTIEKLCLDMFLKANHKVIDLGCGTGRIPMVYGDDLCGYLGVDCSHEMISEAKKLNRKLDFRCEDFLESNYDESSFDVVLLMNNVLDMLHPIDRRQETFSLAKKILKPDGILIYSSHLLDIDGIAGYYKEDYHGALVNTYRSSFSQICEEADACGFEIKLAARDYRYNQAGWAYIVARIKPGN